MTDSAILIFGCTYLYKKKKEKKEKEESN